MPSTSHICLNRVRTWFAVRLTPRKAHPHNRVPVVWAQYVVFDDSRPVSIGSVQ